MPEQPRYVSSQDLEAITDKLLADSGHAPEDPPSNEGGVSGPVTSYDELFTPPGSEKNLFESKGNAAFTFDALQSSGDNKKRGVDVEGPNESYVTTEEFVEEPGITYEEVDENGITTEEFVEEPGVTYEEEVDENGIITEEFVEEPGITYEEEVDENGVITEDYAEEPGITYEEEVIESPVHAEENDRTSDRAGGNIFEEGADLEEEIVFSPMDEQIPGPPLSAESPKVVQFKNLPDNPPELTVDSVEFLPRSELRKETEPEEVEVEEEVEDGEEEEEEETDSDSSEDIPIPLEVHSVEQDQDPSEYDEALEYDASESSADSDEEEETEEDEQEAEIEGIVYEEVAEAEIVADEQKLEVEEDETIEEYYEEIVDEEKKQGEDGEDGQSDIDSRLNTLTSTDPKVPPDQAFASAQPNEITFFPDEIEVTFNPEPPRPSKKRRKTGEDTGANVNKNEDDIKMFLAFFLGACLLIGVIVMLVVLSQMDNEPLEKAIFPLTPAPTSNVTSMPSIPSAPFQSLAPQTSPNTIATPTAALGESMSPQVPQTTPPPVFTPYPTKFQNPSTPQPTQSHSAATPAPSQLQIPSTPQPSPSPVIPSTSQPSPSPVIPSTSQPSPSPTIPLTSQPSPSPTSLSEPPLNDACEDAMGPLSSADSRTMGTLANAGVDNVNTCGDVTTSGPGVWYYVKGTGGEMMAHTCLNSDNIDTKITIFKGDCDNPVCLEGNDDFCGGLSAVSWSSAHEEIYRILVQGPLGYTGDGTFELTVIARYNDDCSTAIGPLVIYPEGMGPLVQGNTTQANPSEFSCGGQANTSPSVFYHVRGNGGDMTANICEGTDFSARISVMAGVCTNMDCIAYSDGGSCTLTWSAEAFQDYYIVIHGDTESDIGNFGLRVTTTVVPSNDDCVDAFGPLQLDGTVVQGNTAGAAIDYSAPFCRSAVTAPGVWYYVIGNGSSLQASLCGGASYDTRLSIYEGVCEQGNLSNLVCVDGNDDFCGTLSLVSWLSDVDAIYYIFVHGFQNGAGDFKLSVTSLS